jgi:hypothetical protein
MVALPDNVLGIHQRKLHAAKPEPRPDRGVRQMRVDQIVFAVADQPAQAADPAKPRTAEAVHRDLHLLKVGYERILLRQHVRHLVGEP